MSRDEGCSRPMANKRFRWDPTVSLGNVLSLVVVVVTISIFIATTRAEVEQNKKAIVEETKERIILREEVKDLVELKTNVAILNAHMENVKKNLDLMREDLSATAKSMSSIAADHRFLFERDNDRN